jgi:hypothetical protein
MQPIALGFVASLALLCGGTGGAARVTERTFSLELELASRDFTFVVSEAGRDDERRMPAHVREEARLLEVEDDCSDDAAPCERFTRLYRSVVASVRIGSADQSAPRTANGRLHGLEVSFERKARGGYGRKSEGLGARRLQMLRVNLALDGWLPEAVAAPGERWEIPYAQFERLLWPQERELRPPARQAGTGTGLDLSPSVMRQALPVLLSKLDGRCMAELVPAEDGAAGFEARLEFRFEGKYDGADSLIVGYEGGEVRDDVAVLYEGTGTLSWDPASSRIEVRCSGALRLLEEFHVRVEEGGNAGDVKGSLLLEGSLALEARQSSR